MHYIYTDHLSSLSFSCSFCARWKVLVAQSTSFSRRRKSTITVASRMPKMIDRAIQHLFSLKNLTVLSIVVVDFFVLVDSFDSSQSKRMSSPPLVCVWALALSWKGIGCVGGPAGWLVMGMIGDVTVGGAGKLGLFGCNHKSACIVFKFCRLPVSQGFMFGLSCLPGVVCFYTFGPDKLWCCYAATVWFSVWFIILNL